MPDDQPSPHDAPDEVEGALGLRVSNLLEAGRWQADLVPAPCFFEDAGSRPSVAIVVAGGGIQPFLMSVPHTPSEISEVVDCISDSLQPALQEARPPHTIELRCRSIAEFMRGPFAERGVPLTITSSATLSAVDEFMNEMFRATMPGFAGGPPFVSRPGSWAAWNLTPDQSRRLFAAAARLYASDLWEAFPRPPLLRAQRGAGAEWMCHFTSTDEERRFSIAEMPDLDIEGDDEGVLGQMLAQMAAPPPQIHLRFASRNKRPPSMLRESDAAGWAVAHAGAYPDLIPTHTPGGGITTEQADDLIALMVAVVDFAEIHPVELAKGELDTEGVRWTHPALGVVLHYHGNAPRGDW